MARFTEMGDSHRLERRTGSMIQPCDAGTLRGHVPAKSPRRSAKVPASRREVPLTDRALAQANERWAKAEIGREVVVREEPIGPKWTFRHQEELCLTALRMRFDWTVVERSGGPVGHKLPNNTALQRCVEKPSQESERNAFKDGKSSSTFLQERPFD